MNRNLCILLSIIVLVIASFSGCFGNNDDTTTLGTGVTIESEIVEFTYSNLEYIKDSGETVRIEAQYLFRNIANRNIRFNVTAWFYDKDDNLLYNTSDNPKDFTFPDGYYETYTDAGLAPSNIISYNGEYITNVDHVVIKAIERGT
ncbi:MAG: hypothetical protein KAR55_03450 [Thermoplasmatales archaeon]|nr:hypothetical protein [Thermoplasmatales archaeon]